MKKEKNEHIFLYLFSSCILAPYTLLNGFSGYLDTHAVKMAHFTLSALF